MILNAVVLGAVQHVLTFQPCEVPRSRPLSYHGIAPSSTPGVDRKVCLLVDPDNLSINVVKCCFHYPTHLIHVIFYYILLQCG